MLLTSRLLFAGFVALLLNSAYLTAFADPSLWYFTNVVLHPLLGLTLAVALARRTPRIFLRWPSLKEAPDFAFAMGVCSLGAGALLGALVLATGATRPYRPLLYAHVTTSALGAALLAAHLWREASRHPARRVAAAIRVSLAAAFLAAAAAAIAWSGRDAERRQAYRIENPVVVADSMDQEGMGPKGPFFPSSADTNVRGLIPAGFFLTSETCGKCHRDIYQQWNSSAHHFSSFNNQWYRKSIEYMQDVIGTRP